MNAARGPASAASCSGRTFDGPQPKRPSAGLRSAGIFSSALVTAVTDSSVPAGAASALWPPGHPPIGAGGDPDRGPQGLAQGGGGGGNRGGGGPRAGGGARDSGVPAGAASALWPPVHPPIGAGGDPDRGPQVLAQ